MRFGQVGLLVLLVSAPVNWSLSSAAAQGPLEGQVNVVDSTITRVTVYQDRAKVVRSLEVPASAQQQRLRLSDLPELMDQQSVRWESAEGVMVRSLYVQPALSNGDREALDEEVTKLQDRLADAVAQIAVIEQDLETLERLAQFSASKADGDLNRGQLNAGSLLELMEGLTNRRRALATELQQARRAKLDVDRDLRRLTDGVGAAAEFERPKRSFNVDLIVEAEQGGQLEVTYWVSGVAWTPQYIIEAQSAQANSVKLQLRLDAQVLQGTGEDWDNVKLTFSTGSPSLQADSPTLVPLRVSVPGMNGGGQPTANQFGFGGWQDQPIMQNNLQVNASAAESQITDVNLKRIPPATLADDAVKNIGDEFYSVDQLISVPSQDNSLAVTLLNVATEAKTHHVVTPLLSQFGHRESLIDNPTARGLVGGGCQSYLDGRFVGRSTIPPTASSGKIRIGLGVDQDIRARRQLIGREDKTKGANRLSTLKYRITLANHLDSVADVRLYDRLPVSSSDNAFNIMADASTLGEISDDARYLELRRPDGILRWDFELPAKSVDDDIVEREFGYTIELPAGKVLDASASANQMTDDLQFLQMKGGMGGGMGGMGGGVFRVPEQSK